MLRASDWIFPDMRIDQSDDIGRERKVEFGRPVDRFHLSLKEGDLGRIDRRQSRAAPHYFDHSWRGHHRSACLWIESAEHVTRKEGEIDLSYPVHPFAFDSINRQELLEPLTAQDAR